MLDMSCVRPTLDGLPEKLPLWQKTCNADEFIYYCGPIGRNGCRVAIWQKNRDGKYYSIMFDTGEVILPLPRRLQERLDAGLSIVDEKDMRDHHEEDMAEFYAPLPNMEPRLDLTTEITHTEWLDILSVLKQSGLLTAEEREEEGKICELFWQPYLRLIANINEQYYDRSVLVSNSFKYPQFFKKVFVEKQCADKTKRSSLIKFILRILTPWSSGTP